MSTSILLLEAVNLFVGDANPEMSKHLKITSLGLPVLEYDTVDHAPGGGAMTVAWSMGVLKKIEPTFKLAGFDQEAYKLFGIGTGSIETFTIHGVIRDKREAKLLHAEAIIRGSIGRVAPEAFTRAAEFEHDHRIDEVTHYELTIDGKEWYWVDFWTSPRPRVFGSEDREYMAALGLV